MKRPSIASAIAKKEGKKVQVSIGNIREIEKVQFDIAVEEILTFIKDTTKVLSDCYFIRLHDAAVIEAKKRIAKEKK